ncbi:GntR family transcriptional regulator [Jannaschia sp. CCS1]|uniref:GntR family transcriptional regulator n=1 Tax=Jannaschia sp. (strain CCS1) TaxID=290400 RepID=UPI000053C4A7|nr:GntR family transcriptional regulator [Jannaschia sp. CCS1]ABD56621.1 transcriptional regulator, GntR family [Jannaschia sp. CCS1]
MARTPLYQTVETDMITRITKGEWEVGRRLPNEFGLADEFGVSQGTMRRALISLEGMGYLSRKPGRGTIVAARAAAAAPTVGVAPVLLDGDGDPLTMDPFRARRDTRRATPAEADTMGCERVAVLERTLKHKGRRAALDVVVVPEALVDTLDEDAPAALKPLLEHHGITPARIEAEARAEVTDMAGSVALSVERYTALLVIRTAAYGADGQVIARQIQRIAVENARLAHQ